MLGTSNNNTVLIILYIKRKACVEGSFFIIYSYVRFNFTSFLDHHNDMQTEKHNNYFIYLIFLKISVNI